MKAFKHLIIFLISASLYSEQIQREDFKEECKGDCENGKATLTAKDKDGKVVFKYEGSFKQKKFHGKGIITYENLNSFTYEGDFDSNNFHGKGKIKFQNGNTFEGAFENNLLNGAGILTMKNGDRIEGDFFGEISRWSGSGTFSSVSKKDRYTGSFKEGKFHGFGFYFYPDNSKYIGFFNSGKPEGPGYYISDNKQYIGIFENLNTLNIGYYFVKGKYFDYLEIKDGKQTKKYFISPSLGQYISEKNDFRNIGIKADETGNVFFGELEDDLPEGQGQFITSEGHCYYGNFKNGKFDGEGILYNKDGKVIYSGNWKNGKLDK